MALLLLVAFLIAANALFVAAEFSLVAVQRGAVEERAERGDRRARAALLELDRLSFVLSAAQFGITVTSLLVGFLAEGAIGDTVVAPVVESLGMSETTATRISLTAAFLLTTVLQMVVGELAPKNLAISEPESVAVATARPMRAFGVMFGPVIRLFDDAAAWVTERVFGVEVKDTLAGGHTLDELSRIIDASTLEGVFSGDQADLLARAVGLGDRRVAEIMIPAPQIEWVEADEPMERLREHSGRTGFSRFPVRRDGQIVGSVHIKDLLQPDLHQRAAAQCAADVLVVPESEPLRRLLSSFRTDRRTFALVVDEFGSVAGLVTLEDLLEQLVGEIEDEFDPERAPSVRRVGRGRFVVAGTLRLDPFDRTLGTELPRGDYETVAGLIMEALGRVPEVGARIEVADVVLTVRRMQGVRVAEVEVDLTPGQR